MIYCYCESCKNHDDDDTCKLDTITISDRDMTAAELDHHIPKILRDRLKAIPSVQPGTAKRIVGKSRDGMTLWYQCDMCNEPVDEKDTFCSGCGRRFVNERSD